MNELNYSTWRKVKAGVQYAMNRSGPMSGNGLYVGAFVKSDKALERPDLQINMFAWSTVERTRDRHRLPPFPGLFAQSRCICGPRDAAPCG